MKLARNRRLRESQDTHEIIFKYTPDVHFAQSAIDDRLFKDNFDEYLLVNSHFSYNPGRECARMVAADNKEFGPRGLAEYIGEDDVLFGKVANIQLSFDSDEELLIVTCTVTVEPTDSFVKDLKDYITGQLSDGWGEGFEQQPVANGTVYAVINESDEYDVEFFGSEQQAYRTCDRRNREAESYEESDEDAQSYYVEQIDVEVTYSFWSRKFNNLTTTIVDGIDEKGFGRDGYNREGYDRSGFDREGYDKDGFSSKGLDREGFDREGNKTTRAGYKVNKADLEGISPEEYEDMFESYKRDVRIAEARLRIAKKKLKEAEEENDLPQDIDDMTFSKTSVTKKGKEIVRTKPDGTKVKQSKDGPVAKATVAVLDKAKTDDGTVRTLRSYSGEDKRVKAGAGKNLGEPGIYGADTDSDGDVDNVYVVSKKDIENAKVESRKRAARRTRVTEARRRLLMKAFEEE